jgi:FkbM family methyltransferase
MNAEHRLAQVLLRAWPFPRGAGRIADKLFSQLKFEETLATVQTTDGFKMTVDPNDLIGRQLYLMGEFDRSIVELLLAFAEPNDVLLDIGANVGYVSGCFLQNVSQSSVVAVEPQEALVSLLKVNLPPERAKIFPYALSTENGEAFFELDQSNSGAARIVQAPNSNAIKIPTRTPDAMFRELAIKKIDLIKIDAEGFEKPIVQGLYRQIKITQPRAIIFEDSAGSAVEIASMLEDYHTFGIIKKIHALRLTTELKRSHDYIAISKLRPIPSRARDRYSIAN